MKNKSLTLKDIQDDFIEFIDLCNKYTIFTCSKKIQKEQVIKCEEYIKKIKYYKQCVTHNNIEEVVIDAFLNELFHMQCFVNSISSILSMWIELKDEKSYSAWCCLVSAQEYIEVASKIKEYEGVINWKKRLLDIEKLIFPNLVYLSGGYIESIGKCSICSKNFTECDHVENHVYMGKLCQRVDKEIKAVHHVAIVKNPRDRRCIIKSKTIDGYYIDCFTFEKTGKKSIEKDGALHCESIILSTSELDLY
jgi:hypothetical protein